MPFADVFPGTIITPRMEFEFGWFETRSVDFAFYVKDPADALIATVHLSRKTGTISGSVASCTSDVCPAVPAGLEHYRVVVEAVLTQRGTKQLSTTIYRVWPATVPLTFVPVDTAGLAQPARAIPFTLSYDRQAAAARTTLADGTYDIAVIRGGGRIDVGVVSPWRLVRWTTGAADAGRTRQAEVELFEAGFISPAAGAKLEWAVNRQTTNAGADRRGQVVTVTVGRRGDAARGAASGMRGARVYIVATYSITTARTDHAPTLKKVTGLVTSPDKKKQTAYVTIGAGLSYAFDVDLGFAGGETCKLEIGTELRDDGTLLAVHDTLDFENWREFDYELALPQADGADRITDVTEFKSKTVAGLPDTTVAMLKKILDPVKVRLKFGQALFCNQTHLLDDGRGSLYADGTLFGKAGQRVFILSNADAVGVMNRALNASAAELLRLVVADYLAISHPWDQLFKDIDREGPHAVVAGRPSCLAIDRAIDTQQAGFARGQYPISKLRWKVTHYLAADAPWTDFPEEVEAGRPGWDYRDWAELTLEDDIKQHVTLAKENVSFRFPAGKATFPGQVFTNEAGKLTITTDKKYVLTLSIQLQGVCIDFALGGAGRGNVVLSSYGNTYHANGLARALAHELGHCMGQGYGGKTLDAVRGRTAAMPGIPFPAAVPGGDIYTEHGDRGIHCANGLLRKDEATYSYATADAEAACVMFGHGSLASATEYAFCANCRTYILAEKLDDIRTNWEA
jgi:hypothetical protein